MNVMSVCAYVAKKDKGRDDKTIDKTIARLTLDLLLAAAARVVALRPDGVNLVDEDDGWRLLVRHAEKLANHLRAVAQVLLD